MGSLNTHKSEKIVEIFLWKTLLKLTVRSLDTHRSGKKKSWQKVFVKKSWQKFSMKTIETYYKVPCLTLIGVMINFDENYWKLLWNLLWGPMFDTHMGDGNFR